MSEQHFPISGVSSEPGSPERIADALKAMAERLKEAAEQLMVLPCEGAVIGRAADAALSALPERCCAKCRRWKPLSVPVWLSNPINKFTVALQLHWPGRCELENLITACGYCCEQFAAQVQPTR